MEQKELQLTDIQPIKSEPSPGMLLFESRVQAGFPSPAQGEYADSIDLNRALITHAAATFCARVMGNSMIDAGINEGDLLIIDRALEPHDGNIAVCFIDGDFTVKRLSVRDEGIFLTPANAAYPEIKVEQDNNFVVWGVVSHIIKKL